MGTESSTSSLSNDPNLFEHIFQTIPDGVIITRADDGAIINVNRGFEKLLGYSKDEAIGRTTIDLGIWCNPEDRQKMLEELALRGTVDDFVTQHQRKDGSRISVLAFVSHLERKGDHLILALIKDIDQLSSLGRDLGTLKARYAELVDLLPAVLFECDEDLRITFLNAAGEAVVGGATRGEGLQLTSLVSPRVGIDLHSWALEAREHSLSARIEVEAHRVDGTAYPAILTLSASRRSSGRDGYRGVLIDVTDLKKSQDRLTKLSQAVEQSPSLVLITDRSGHIEYVNPSFTRLTAFTNEEVLGRTPRILKSGVVPEETYREMWNTILAGKEWKTEILNRKKNGETYWQRSIISPIYDDDANITHFLEVAEDITREKELESELFQSQKMEAIGHLAGGIAHDFNNMLTIIIGVGELLADHLGDSEELKGYTDSILSAARKSASLTHQLLAFSRKQLLHPTKIDINEVIKDAGKLLHRIVGDNISLRTKLAEDLGTALLDQSQLNQIILNLVVNAKEAITGSGRIAIATSRFDTDRETVVYSGRLSPGAYVVLSIADSGSGMDEETLRRVFEPFFTTKSTGTGLGLATVYGIVQQSDGQIDVESEPKKGTTFTLYFPLVTDRGDESSPAARRKKNSDGSETILVVEDDEAVRTFVSEVLSSHGYTVLLADSAERAQELWKDIAAQVDLLLTDVVLPQEDGVRLYSKLRQSRPQLPVVYMSGYTDDSQSVLRELADGKSLLPKPFGAEQLTAAVRRTLDTTTRR